MESSINCAEELGFSPVLYRSPLDLAYDLRGAEQLYLDMFDDPKGLERLLDKCAEAIIGLDRLIRDRIRLLRDGPGGAMSMSLPAPTMLFNGNPIDLISAEMVEQFDRTPMEKVTDYAGSAYFHHHSIGVRHAEIVRRMRGLTVQMMAQDPNGPLLTETVDEKVVETSLKVPIVLRFLRALHREKLIDFPSQWKSLLDRTTHGRFIFDLILDTPEECRYYVESVRKASNLY